MVRISENLHRREITALERAELYARWVEIIQSGDKKKTKLIALERQAIAKKKKLQEAELNAKGVEIVSRQAAAKPVGRPKGGVREAARLAGVSERDLRRSIKTASLSDDAKEAAKASGLDDNQSALLDRDEKAGSLAGLCASAAGIRSQPRLSAPKYGRLWRKAERGGRISRRAGQSLATTICNDTALMTNGDPT